MVAALVRSAGTGVLYRSRMAFVEPINLATNCRQTSYVILGS